MENKSVALLIYGDINSGKNAITDEKYKELASSLVEAGFNVKSVLYHDSNASRLEEELMKFHAVLVWVNPIEQGNNRSYLDKLLLNISGKGIYVTTHPDVILKIGTKKVLYTTKDMDWGGDVEIYTANKDFQAKFINSLSKTGTRILKRYRGNGGNGVFKICFTNNNKSIKVIHAPTANEERIYSIEEFEKEFAKYCENEDLLISQEWNKNITNGMVRCYLTGNKVSGFGYQESNALCPQSDEPDSKVRPVSKRFYFSEKCALFQDLRKIMETKWIPQLQESHSLFDELMPLIWDIDLFINDVNSQNTEKKFTLCEINVSCVSPFPPSSINCIVNELKNRIVIK